MIVIELNRKRPNNLLYRKCQPAPQYTKLQNADAAELQGNELPETLRGQNSRDFQECRCKISRVKAVFTIEAVAGRTRTWLTRGHNVRTRPATAHGAGNAIADTVRRSDRPGEPSNEG